MYLFCSVISLEKQIYSYASKFTREYVLVFRFHFLGKLSTVLLKRIPTPFSCLSIKFAEIVIWQGALYVYKSTTQIYEVEIIDKSSESLNNTVASTIFFHLILTPNSTFLYQFGCSEFNFGCSYIDCLLQSKFSHWHMTWRAVPFP